MTPNFTRAALALALALGLAGCGGKATFPVSGSITGLSNDGLVLSTNGMDLTVDKAATTFSFANTLSYGDVYAVIAKSQPAHQVCQVFNGSDTAGRTAAIHITVACALNQFTIGGTISGLSSDGLVLSNGSIGGTASAVSGATSFTFASPVAFGVSYGVSVLTQPKDATCSVTQNGTGVMGDAAVTNIAVSCIKNP
jgi:hypothetical protein